MAKIRRIKSFYEPLDNNPDSHSCNRANIWLRLRPWAKLIDWRVALADGQGYMYLISLLIELDEIYDTDEYLL